MVEQIVRPTGLTDPMIEVKPARNQVDALLAEVKKTIAEKERVLITTLTKRFAEDLTDFLLDAGIKTKYLHSEVDTLERIAIVRDLRLGKFDVLVGVNLLGRGSTCRRSPSSPSWTRTKRGSCAPTPRSYRRAAGRRGISTAG